MLGGASIYPRLAGHTGSFVWFGSTLRSRSFSLALDCVPTVERRSLAALSCSGSLSSFCRFLLDNYIKIANVYQADLGLMSRGFCETRQSFLLIRVFFCEVLLRHVGAGFESLLSIFKGILKIWRFRLCLRIGFRG